MSEGSSPSAPMDSMDVLELNFLTVQLGDESLNKIKNNNNNKRNDSERIISLNQLSRHDRHDDCWIAVYDRVYDCTEFIAKHPGGQDVILEYAGRDATLAFVGSGHSAEATAILQDYLVGQLPPNERLFVVPANDIEIVRKDSM
ncbi:cytochrome b5-like [Diachasma alloeum]|uniref:cytochrome b5-like n=1 Tax=Diachasma alloeum TaxID=454923 RepID=UPI0007384DE2|nr:cytochrome b5-like [Diachasma alloeum]